MSKADKFFARAERLVKRLEAFVPGGEDMVVEDAIAWRWRADNSGSGYLEAITRFSSVKLPDLLHIDRQKDELTRNTRQFLAGLPANNALLWGPRGTGKSSLVKAVLNDFADAGLRLVEVDRLHLVDLPQIIEQLDNGERKIVIYCDDLSFDANDATYRALKSVLDGSILDNSENIIIYATSNRRHLLPELKADNQDSRVIDGELHHSEAVEETISLSERFGLWLAFHPLDQERYLDIVKHWLANWHIDFASDQNIRGAALEWALRRGSRSGRTAYQFARDWAGRKALENASYD